MDYTSIFEISATGMDFQRLRMETVANNLANMNTTRGVNGEVYRPLEAVAMADAQEIGTVMKGVEDIRLVERFGPPRSVFNPEHPDADAQGYVTLPNVNPVDEMVNLMTATRAYEANIRVLNAAKSMAMRALEIGGNS